MLSSDNGLSVDVRANRKSRKWSKSEQLGRILWAVARPLFALSPRPLWGWRRFLLRMFGAKIGRDAHLRSSVKIEIPWNLTIGDEAGIGDGAILYALGPISIGNRTTISQYAHLCAGSHDYRDRAMPLTKPPISIGEDVWVCTGAFVGPGVVVGDRAIVGACAVAVKEVPPDVIVAGNPARVVGARPALA